MTPTSGKPTTDPKELRVAVGVDRSDCGNRALALAAHEAAFRGALLHIVCAYEDTPSTTPWPVVQPQIDQVSAAAIVDDSLSRAQAIEPAIVAKGEIRYGPAGRVLVEASRDAIMLVVGSRGRSEVAGALFGSVSDHCVHHAAPAVTVVR